MGEFSIERGSASEHLDSKIKTYIRNELDNILNDKKFMQDKVRNTVWRSAYGMLEDLFNIASALLEKYSINGEYSKDKLKETQCNDLRELVKKSIEGNKKIIIKDNKDVLSYIIKDVGIIISNKTTLRGNGITPESDENISRWHGITF